MARKKAASVAAPEPANTARINRARFGAALKVVGKAITAKDPTNPDGMCRLTIVERVVVEGLEFGALAARVSLDYDGTATLDVLVSHASLAGAVARFEGDELAISTPTDHVLRIRAGGSTFDLRSLPGREAKSLPQIGDLPVLVELPALELLALLNAGGYAPSEDVSRPHIACVAIEFVPDGKPIVVSTDGHRMALALAGRGEPPMASQIALVLDRAVKLLREMLEQADATCSLRLDSQYLHATVGDAACSLRRVDAAFPPWHNVVPFGKRPHTAIVDREPLMRACKRLALLANESRVLMLRWTPEGLRLSVRNANLGDGYEELPVEAKTETFAINCSAVYLHDALVAVPDDRVILGLGKNEEEPITIACEDGTLAGVVMPMRA